MTTDNRTNEPGRCWCDHRESNHYGGESCRVFGCTCPRFAIESAGRLDEHIGNADRFNEAMARAGRKFETVQSILSAAGGSVSDAMQELSLARAALVAAQGAAPQAESAPPCSIRQEVPWPPHASATFMYSRYLCECGWAGNTFRDVKNGDGKELALEIAKRHFEESLATPVLPSSPVDEDALAEVLSLHVLGEPNGGTASWAWINCSCNHRIEIAGVTREHVVALGRKHQARAVAEWLKGAQ